MEFLSVDLGKDVPREAFKAVLQVLRREGASEIAKALGIGRASVYRVLEAPA